MNLAGPIRGMLDRPLVTGKQVAAMLSVSPAWFYKHAPRLQRERGFPAPAIHSLYDAKAIHAWLDAQMDPKLRKLLERPT